MRGKIRLLAAAPIAAFALAACGGGGMTPALGTNSGGAPPAAPASIAVSFAGTPNAVTGLSETFALNVVVKDGHGTAIQGTYAQPVRLSDSDTSGVTKLSATNITSSAQTVSLTYSGARLSGPVTISATMSGVPAGSVTNATFNADGSHSYVPGEQLTYQRTTYVTATQRNSPAQSSEEVDDVTVAVQPSPASFNGQTGLTDVVTSYSNASAGVAETSHDYYAYLQGNPVDLLHYGWTDETTLSYPFQERLSGRLTYDAPSIADELPQTTGATWNPAQASHETLTDQLTDGNGTSYVDTSKWITAADGSYQSATETALGGASDEVVDYVQSAAKSDASFTFTDVSASSTTQPYTMEVAGGPPASTGIPYQMHCDSDALNLPASPLLAVTPGSFPTPAPSVTPFPRCLNLQTGASQMTWSTATPAPDWYPSDPLPLDQEQYTLVGTGVPIPSDCQVPASLATAANQLHYAQQLLDPVREMVQETQDSYFVPNIGLVCSLETVNVSFYAAASLLGTPTERVHENIVYTLAPSANTSAASARRADSSTVAAIGVLVAANIRLNERARMLTLYRRARFR